MREELIGTTRCLSADYGDHLVNTGLGVSRRLRIRWGVLVDTVALEGAVPKPAGYNVIALSDQIYCGGDLRGPGVAAAPVLQSGSGQAVPRHGGKNPAAGDRIGPRDHGIFLN